jgi:hypothetical protein
VQEDVIEKSYTAPGGTVIPSTIHFYTMTAPGIDKIEGPGEFTMPKLHGIKVEATGQNIITLWRWKSGERQVRRRRTVTL